MGLISFGGHMSELAVQINRQYPSQLATGIMAGIIQLLHGMVSAMAILYRRSILRKSFILRTMPLMVQCRSRTIYDLVSTGSKEIYLKWMNSRVWNQALVTAELPLFIQINNLNDSAYGGLLENGFW